MVFVFSPLDSLLNLLCIHANFEHGMCLYSLICKKCHMGLRNCFDTECITNCIDFCMCECTDDGNEHEIQSTVSNSTRSTIHDLQLSMQTQIALPSDTANDN